MATNYTVTPANVLASAYAKRFAKNPPFVMNGMTPVPNLCMAGAAITAGVPVFQGFNELWFPADATPLLSQTSGTLTVGKRYIISTFVAGDDFTNVGAASNATNTVFYATGTTPTTWTHSSVLADGDAIYKVEGIAANNAGIGQAVDVVTEDPIFTPGCTMLVGDNIILSSDVGRICADSEKASGWYVAFLMVAFSTTQAALKIVRSDAPKA